MYPDKVIRSPASDGLPWDMATLTPMLRSEVCAIAAVMVTRSPTRIGWRNSMPSTDAVATGQRQ